MTLPSSPTPPDAEQLETVTKVIDLMDAPKQALTPPPDEFEVLRKIVAQGEDAYRVLYPDEVRIVASLLRAHEGMRADAERLDWLEANGRALMCWNVSDDPAVEHWSAPMKPNNGWTVSWPDDNDEREPSGTTAREAIDWAMKLAARASAPDSEVRDG